MGPRVPDRGPGASAGSDDRDRRSATGPDGAPLVILMPLYNDWAALPLLFERLDKALGGAGLPAEVVVVDDGSASVPEDREWLDGRGYAWITSVTTLHLGRNVGHQRAIAIGLAYVHAHRPCRAVVVMDADGEDDPEDVPRLLVASGTERPALVFAHRAERSEGPVFRALYRLYRIVYRLLTGSPISFGNFSVVPNRLLTRLVLLSELWNHYPSAVVKARLPFATIPVQRAHRLAGRSHMNLVSLVLHGLGGIAVHGDVIGVRALLGTLVAIVACVVGIGVVVAIRFATTLAIPGWATYVVGLLVAILLQAVLLSLVFIFMILNSRNYSTVIPRRDYGDYIASVVERRVERHD
jgi:polyisoprenyl-phosphate glycosyltransferase